MTGKQVKRWRERAGFRVAAVANAANVTVRTVERWEAGGKLSLKIQQQVVDAAKALRIPPP